MVSLLIGILGVLVLPLNLVSTLNIGGKSIASLVGNICNIIIGLYVIFMVVAGVVCELILSVCGYL